MEYVFFHAVPCEHFVAFLQAQGLTPEVRRDEECWEVRLPELLDDDLSEAIEARYDELLALNQRLHDEEQEGEEQAAGVVVELADGETVYAQVPPQLLARIMSVLTPQEFGEVVDAIVDAVERPDPRSLCQRLRDA